MGESPIEGYELDYRILDNGSDIGWTAARDNGLIAGTSFTISGLKPGTKYEMRVTAVNKGGHGPRCHPESAVTISRYFIQSCITILLMDGSQYIRILKDDPLFLLKDNLILINNIYDPRK